jgi:hypothetical protein
MDQAVSKELPIFTLICPSQQSNEGDRLFPIFLNPDYRSSVHSSLGTPWRSCTGQNPDWIKGQDSCFRASASPPDSSPENRNTQFGALSRRYAVYPTHVPKDHPRLKHPTDGFLTSYRKNSRNKRLTYHPKPIHVFHQIQNKRLKKKKSMTITLQKKHPMQSNFLSGKSKKPTSLSFHKKNHYSPPAHFTDGIHRVLDGTANY